LYTEESVEVTTAMYVFRNVIEMGLEENVVILKLESEESMGRGVRGGKS
jgi:hypothetical protein